MTEVKRHCNEAGTHYQRIGIEVQFMNQCLQDHPEGKSAQRPFLFPTFAAIIQPLPSGDVNHSQQHQQTIRHAACP